MNIEKEIFEKTKLDYSKLIAFGFKPVDNYYVYESQILNHTFNILIKVKDNQIKAKVFDLLTNEEYTNFRVSGELGSFSSKVKEELINLLTKIKNTCCENLYFFTPQANRITNQIISIYKDYPEFVWENSKDDGIFRNPKNKKWYGLIMKINANKLTNIDKVTNVLNLKLTPSKIEELVQIPGYYYAYHMNKKHWLSIILDDTLKDEEIFKLVEESHAFTEK